MLSLRQWQERFVIQLDGRELMSSWDHGSEELLARVGCSATADRPAPRVLIGGLGMGFTVRATLDQLGDDARVVVAEIAAPVAEWCRGPLAHLADDPLGDARVELRIADVAEVIRTSRARFDAILLDVDNGPQGLTRPGNQGLYSAPGLAVMHRTLRPGGALAVWSAASHPAFERRLQRAGFAVETHREPGRRSRPLVWLARTAARTLF